MNILCIALNDIRIVLKDRQILLWWLAMPLAFVFIFSFTVNDYTSDGIYLPVLQYDDHELADLFVEQLHGEGYWVHIRPREDEHLIGDWPRALVIPENFSQSILQGQRVNLTLAEGSDTPERSISAKALLARVLVKLNTAVAAIDLVERGWNPETKKSLLAEFNKSQTLTVEAQQHFSLRPPPTGFAFTLPAYLVMFVMMMTMMYGGSILIYERQGKQIHRLAASPVSLLEIFLGKLLGKMLQPILQGIILLLAGVFIFRISFGDHPSALAPVILSFAFFCGSAGLLFGLLVRSEQQVMGFGLLVSMILGALGGCWWPLEVAPEVFKTVALFTPTYWAMQGLHDVMSFGKSWMGVLPECGILCALGVILTSISMPLFRWN